MARVFRLLLLCAVVMVDVYSMEHPSPAPAAQDSQATGNGEGTRDMSAAAKLKRRQERLRLRAERDAVQLQATDADGKPVTLALPGPAFAEYDFTAPKALQARAAHATGAESAKSDDASCAGSAELGDAELKPYQKRFLVAGQPLYIASFADTLSENTHEVQTASSVWSCAIVLAKYLEALQARDTEGTGLLNAASRVLELGSGTGLAGVAAARLLGAQPRRGADTALPAVTGTGSDAAQGEVVVTDVADVVPSLAHTIAINANVRRIGYPLRAAALDWTRAHDDLRGT